MLYTRLHLAISMEKRIEYVEDGDVLVMVEKRKETVS